MIVQMIENKTKQNKTRKRLNKYVDFTHAINECVNDTTLQASKMSSQYTNIIEKVEPTEKNK